MKPRLLISWQLTCVRFSTGVFLVYWVHSTQSMTHHDRFLTSSQEYNRVYIQYASLMPRFKNPSVAGPEFRDKRKRRRPKCERGRSKREHGRYVSEAAPRFGNLCVYEPSALRKKPSDYSEKTFRFSEEAFRFAAELCHKRISERHSKSRHQF